VTAWLLPLVLSAQPADPWVLPDRHARAKAGPAPSAFQRGEALDELEAALKRWPRERRQFELDRAEKERWQVRLPEEPRPEEKPDQITPEPEIVRKPGVQPSRFGKIIEIAPDPQPRKKPGNWIEAEIYRLEDDQGSLEQLKEENPQAYAREKARRATVREGNRAWDAAVAKRNAEQAAAIEAEAARMQARLLAVRRKEAEANARRLGGTLDAEGNFVDPDLEEKK
jgi:hypothetical protein